MTTATKTRKTRTATIEQPVIEQTTEATTKKGKEPRECLCGCGEMTGGGRFKPGHDAKLHSALLKASRAGDESATARLAEFGWNDNADTGAREAEKAKARAERTAQRIAKLDEQITELTTKRDALKAELAAAS